MQVREIMSKDIAVVDRNDTLRAVEERMAAKQLRHLPVLEQGDIVGIVTQRDLFKAAMSSTMGYGEKAQQAYLRSVRVKEIMTYPVVTIAPDTSIAAAAEMIITKSAEKPRRSRRGWIGVGRDGLNAQEPNNTHAVPEPSMGEGAA